MPLKHTHLSDNQILNRQRTQLAKAANGRGGHTGAATGETKRVLKVC